LSIDYLKDIPFFAGLAQKQRKLIQSVCREIFIHEGRVIISQADVSYDLYVVLSGRVKVSLLDRKGNEIILDLLDKGDFFGEMSLFDKRPRSATVTAVTECRMLVLTHDVFLKTIKKDADIAIKILNVLTERLRKADERIETLAFLDVCGRVARALMDTATRDGHVQPNGSISLKRITHQEIAYQIGASREAVTKALKSLASQGVIEVSGRSITISPKQFEV
jgi:CRP/FNR family transcriptional regulator, cyclic AMP receptor protein